MSSFKQKLSDLILRNAENRAHYHTKDLNISGFEVDRDRNLLHDSIILDLEESFYNQRYDFISKHITERSKIIEIGDVNGFNIDYFGTADSLGLNFKDYSRNIKSNFKIMDVNNGLDIHELYDHGMMFEVWEHLHNPILVLDQLMNISEKGVFLSIPYVKKTKVRLEMDGGHVFEYSPYDLRKIFDHYGIDIVDYQVLTVLKLHPLLKIFKIHSMLMGAPDSLFGIFEKFQIYYLKKKD